MFKGTPPWEMHIVRRTVYTFKKHTLFSSHVQSPLAVLSQPPYRVKSSFFLVFSSFFDHVVIAYFRRKDGGVKESLSDK